MARCLASVARGCAALLLLGAAAGCTPQPPETATRIDSASLVFGSTRPASGARVGGRDVTLPDYWMLTRRGVATEGWYQMVVDIRDADEPLGVMVDEARLNAEVFFNGSSLGRVGRFEPPIARNPAVPLYFPVPDVLVREGRNQIDLHLATTPGFPGRLGLVWVGPDAELRPWFEASSHLRARGSRAGLVIAMFLAVLIFAEAYSNPEDRAANVFLGGVGVAMALSGAGYFVTETSIPSRLWEWVIGCLTVWTAVLLVFSSHRFLELSRPRLERGLVIGFTAMTIVFGAVPHLWSLTVWVLWFALAVAVYLYLMLLLIQGVRRRELHPAVPIVAFLAIAPWVGLAGRGALAGVAAMGWLVLARTHRQRRENDSVKRQLEARVAEREREVRLSYDKLRTLERSRVVARERERLMRDMHDGTGGQLASALAVARSESSNTGALVSILQEALDDLRLTIESLDPGARDVPSVLGMLRAPLERRLVPAGLRLVWQVGEAGGNVELESEQALHLIRIVQEAVTNAIKHAHARTVTIRTFLADEFDFVIEIRDDGTGCAAQDNEGRGIGNMRSRAAAMDADLEVRDAAPGTPGTVVELTIPV